MSEPEESRYFLGPYYRELVERLTGRDIRALKEWVRGLPLERRYISRMVSCLRLAFEDLDVDTIKLDAETLGSEELKRIIGELERRRDQLGNVLRHLEAH
ncbi:MAG TPA: hypothetical protein VLX32_04755 [Candidatus Acidoferrum sp.]|nr:hypothetical protein [Candidatus Acidoferrum sp.]